MVVDILYRVKIRRTYRSSLPVISIGNITVGGTGKTPLTIMTAEYFAGMGKKVGILTRGYGGDEDVMIDEALQNIKVLSGKNRCKSARAAEAIGLELLIMDDGFQHRTLERDLDIILINAMTFSGNQYLLPRGFLREPVTSIKRADMVVLTKTDVVPDSDLEGVMQRLSSDHVDKPVLTSEYVLADITDFNGKKYELDFFSGKPICAFSGIGDPHYFHHILDKNGISVNEEVIYDDHHMYTDDDYIQIMQKGQEFLFVCTHKDHVKFRKYVERQNAGRFFVVSIKPVITRGKDILVDRFNSVINSKSA